MTHNVFPEADRNPEKFADQVIDASQRFNAVRVAFHAMHGHGPAKMVADKDDNRGLLWDAEGCAHSVVWFPTEAKSVSELHHVARESSVMSNYVVAGLLDNLNAVTFAGDHMHIEGDQFGKMMIR